MQPFDRQVAVAVGADGEFATGPSDGSEGVFQFGRGHAEIPKASARRRSLFANRVAAAFAKLSGVRFLPRFAAASLSL